MPDDMPTLPHIPHAPDGDWREAVVSRFAESIYGHTPSDGLLVNVDCISDRVDGTGRMRILEYTVRVGGPRGAHEFSALVHLPVSAGSAEPTPVFVGLNFYGNHATSTDPQIQISPVKVPGQEPERQARGGDAAAWPYAEICARGYAVVTAHYSEIEPDWPDATEGIRALFPDEPSWGAVGAWAWALSQLVDVVGQIPGLERSRVVGFGHSRLGKAALWAAAQDPRFSAVISHQSGLMGASLTRHLAGEDIAAITSRFPHWFTPSLATFAGREAELDVDQHLLLAAIAPRTVLVISGAEDAWADPTGEYLSVRAAEQVLSTVEPGTVVATRWPETPSLNAIHGSSLGYLRRPGGHGVAPEAWAAIHEFLTKGDPL